MVSYLKKENPFYKPEVVAKALKARFKNRKVMCNCLPERVDVANKDAVNKYHEEARKHWYDNDSSYINDNFDASEIRFITDPIDESNLPLYLFDENPMLDMTDIRDICNEYGYAYIDVYNSLSEKYHQLDWLNSFSANESFRKIFNPKYASDLYQTIWFNWDV